MPQTPDPNLKVQTNIPPPQAMPQENAPPPPQTAQEIAQEILKKRTAGINLDPDTMQVLMAMMMPMVAEMAKTMATELRKPSPEEEAKLLAEKERMKNRSIAAAEAGRQELATIKQQQAGCPHVKPNGQHTFRGQVHSNGWALIRCQRCQISFTVRPLPEHVQHGLNLSEIPGLTIQHLIAWQAQSDKIDKQLAKAEMAANRMSEGFKKMAPNTVSL